MKKTTLIFSISVAVLSSSLVFAQEGKINVNPDLLAPNSSLQVDLSNVSFNEIPKVENTVKTDARQQLNDFVKNIKSATGQFAQVTVGGKKAKPAESGDFSFQRPGKFVWNVTKPLAQSIISDGQTVYQYDPDLMQVTERSAKNAVGASPASVLFGTGSLEQNFTVKVLPAKDGVEWLRATPKVSDAGMKYMDIAFANNLPAELKIVDSFGQTTTIKLRNFKANVAIPASSFKFNAPKGVDRVRLN